MAKPLLPGPLEKAAPKFTHTKSKELPQFWEQMVNYVKNDGITDANKRMKTIVQYVDAESEQHWKDFDAYLKGRWDAFEKEVFDNYLKVQAIKKGSLERLERVCFKAWDLDYDKVLEFI